MRALVLVAALAACAPVAPPVIPDAAIIPAIEMSFGSGFAGTAVYRVAPDGSWRLVATPPGGGAPEERIGQLTPEARASIRRTLIELGPTAAAAPQPELLCLDYGTDRVSVSPPLGGFSAVSADCPVPEVRALIDQILAAFPL